MATTNRGEIGGGAAALGAAVKSGAKILVPAGVVAGTIIKATGLDKKYQQQIDQQKKDEALMAKAKGTQAGHHVTDNNNHTKPVSAADKQAEAKRPAVGNDKSAAKKANGPSWNNGYTN
jgi:uncharacterized membrane protein YebE (DUF533 family)